MKKQTRTIFEMIEDGTPMGKRLSAWRGDGKEVEKVVKKMTSFGLKEAERKVKGTKTKFKTLIEFEDEDKKSRPYIIAKKAAQFALKKVDAKKIKASASIRAGIQGVTGRDPERPEVLSNVGNVCVASFSFGPAGCWKTRLEAAKAFMSELERVAGRGAYISKIVGDSERIDLDVTFRIAEKRPKNRKKNK